MKVAYEDTGTRTLTATMGGRPDSEEFDYNAIDARVFHVRGRDMSPLEAVLELNRRIWIWVVQDINNLDGFDDRAIVAAWILDPILRPHTMTYIAGRFGKKKQSLDRWMRDFKKEFPCIVKYLSHTKHK